MAITFRKYQKEIIDKSVNILYTSRLLYLAMEVRTGKTLTSLGICDNLPVNNVLFITKKKAISSLKMITIYLPQIFICK